MNSFLNCGKRGLYTIMLGGLGILLPSIAQAATPVVTTGSASTITSSGATLNGTVDPKNHLTTVTFDYGTTTGYGSTITAALSPLASGIGATAVTADLTGLACNTTYHFRVNGVNSSGTVNGADANFTTNACIAPPTVTTSAATSLTITGATLNGAVSSNGASTTVTFDYGLTTGYGSTITAAQSPLAAGASGTAVSAALTGLTCNTLYHFRAKGVNSAGTTNGADLTFTTLACPTPPTVTTNAATGLTVSNATLNGTVNSNGAITTVTFDYGLTTGYGSTITAAQSPLAAGASGTAVSAALTGLTCNTLYHYRAKGVNSAGTTNGNDLTFSTSVCPPPVVVLGKAVSASASAVGSYITFTLTASNPTAAPLSNVVVTDVIPAGMTYSAYAATLGTATVSGQTLTWSIPSIPASGGAQLTLVVLLTVKGTYTNTVQSPGATDASASILVLPSAITHYRMDETAGSWNGTAGEVVDSGGNGLSGHRRTTSTPTTTNVVSPSPTIASQHASVVGGFCNAGVFDGNAVVESASSTYFQFTNKLSASAWIYPTAYPASDLYSILSNDVNYEFHLNPAGKLFWWWQASTLTSAATIPLNQWTHIAITMDSSLGASSRERIYINGVQDTSTNNWSGTLATNTCPFYIGGDIGTGTGCALIPGRNFHGMIDEAKIYNYELSAAEVNADMNLGRQCNATSFDHIQIEHDGTASTCTPKVVTVKACMDAGCTSLYPGTVTVKLSPTGWLPSDTLTINGGVASAKLNNTSIIAPSITLGTTSVTPAAVNATRCFNGSTETCTLSVASTSCSFDAVETGANPQTQLYTKLAGTAFNVDVLALSNSTTVNTTYTGTVTVDVVDTSTVACPNGSVLSTTQPTITYVAANKGRYPVSLTSATTSPSAQIRIKSGSSFACSYDKFAIRPSAATLTTNANAAAPGSTALPVIKAGATFNIGATTNPTGYTGLLTVDSTKLTAQLPSSASQQSGGTVGILTLNPNIQANTATSNNATYSEVGYLYAGAGAISDKTFTSVDQNNQVAGCKTTTPESCDCLLSTNATNTGVPDNVSDVAINGRYGCYVGNKSEVSFGRFIPEHFDTTIVAVAGVPMPCPMGQLCPASYNGFVYSGQAFTTHVTASSVSGGTTQNYYGNFAKGVTLSAWDAPGSAVTQNPSGSLSSNTITAATFGGGTAITTTTPPIYTLNTTTTAPINIFMRAEESAGGDGVTSLRASSSSSVEGGVMVVNGRIRVSSAYGSELLPLTVNAILQYWTNLGYVTSATDNINIVTAANISRSNCTGSLLTTGACNALGSINSVVTVPAAPPPYGAYSIKLNAPGSGKPGSEYLKVDTGGWPTWLPSNSGRAAFGIYKGANEFIYMRETY